jgi:hypothetical protein
VSVLKKWSFPKKIRFSFPPLRFSQRKIFWGFVGIAVFVLIYFSVILPLVKAARNAEDEIGVKKRVLQRYDENLRNRKILEDDLGQITKQYEEIQQRLLPGDTPQLGAASLQEIVKRFSEKNGIAIRSFRILEPKEINSYRKISLQIDFNPTNSMLSLGQFIHDIEHQEKELMISEMDLMVFNIRMPNSIQGNMIVSGLMKGTKTKEKGKAG